MYRESHNVIVSYWPLLEQAVSSPTTQPPRQRASRSAKAATRRAHGHTHVQGLVAVRRRQRQRAVAPRRPVAVLRGGGSLEDRGKLDGLQQVLAIGFGRVVASEIEIPNMLVNLA